MSKRHYTRTEGDRHDYIRKGKYWEVFGHLFTVSSSEEWKKRMLALKEEDERIFNRKYVG